MEERPLSTELLDALRQCALFNGLDDTLLAEVGQAMPCRAVPGGKILYREGEPSRNFVVVVRGALRAARRDREGRLLLYNQIPPGQSIGEIAMLMDQPRAQEVIALRDSVVAELSREAYEGLLERHPVVLSRVFMRYLHSRFRNGSDTGEQSNRSHSLVLLPLHGDVELTTLAEDLAKGLGRCLGLPDARIARIHWDAKSGRQRINDQVLDPAAPRVPGGFDLLVYAAHPEDGPWTRFAFHQADQVVLAAQTGRSPGLSALERALMAETGWAYKRQHLVLLHHPDRAQPDPPEPWEVGRTLERTYSLRRGRRDDVDRIARFLTGQAVGVVLGGGGARGFAHLGVLKALGEAGIPVDVLGGNSMGALIGAQVACDFSLEEILVQTQKFAAGGERPTLPLVSLVSGRRVRRDIRRMFGEREFNQLWRPYFAAACNLSRAETVVLDKGPIWRAVLASNSPAGLLPPVLYDGELLVDGAILDNVPIGPMRARLGTPLERRRGNGVVIAIDVDVREGLRADPSLADIGPGSTLRHKFSAGPASPGIGKILYSAGHVGSVSQSARSRQMADKFLEPPVAEFALMAYSKGREIAEVGYRHTVEMLEKWGWSNGVR